ncbi:23S rRNA (adenine(2030)-N(6))-methyltransferase RlmJ [Alkalimarinus alittae]|uniref:Ribosomal RNA large subunit methyltransferase J n=1 Tax=Alkalimarinus alittae TaxID=2961619 RepID=A0ABY6N3P7_9ALTE|nr:23S rRNA (adenine(2030)-N(6))-methyltransferase RlmJ [Alkalimarinus alittae]UZE96630.1 23S rRNA (adenine(2030)-N(6))-methyltransferase RlmJ [Alkalimarinus alittae]
MLSYRHSYHAGNFADVLKHCTQLAIIEYLKRKDKPFCYHDTHSGAGVYTVYSAEMQKNGEYQSGIGKLFGRRTGVGIIDHYIDLIGTLNPTGRLNNYPGSPQITLLARRPTDRMQLTELHPADYSHLQSLVGKSKKVKVYQQDAWQGLKSLLPPAEKRGLVLIDPSYEVKQDYKTIVSALQQAHKRFSSGIFAIWYPVLERKATEQFIDRLASAGIPNMLRIEHCILPDVESGMTGSGMVVVNPPYTLKADMEIALPVLDKLLSEGMSGSTVLEQLTEE